MKIPLLLGILSFGTIYFDPPKGKNPKKTELHPLLRHLAEPTGFIPCDDGYHRNKINAKARVKGGNHRLRNPH